MATRYAKVLRDELPTSERSHVACPGIEQADILRSVCGYADQGSVRVDDGLASAPAFTSSEIIIPSGDGIVVCDPRNRAEFTGCTGTTARGVRRAIKVVVRRVGERQV